jgi:hypothetical protein
MSRREENLCQDDVLLGKTADQDEDVLELDSKDLPLPKEDLVINDDLWEIH